MPIPDQSHWPLSDLEKLSPPPLRKSAGRPKKQRRRTIDELPDGSRMTRHGQLNHCSKCGQNGHKFTTCRNYGVKTRNTKKRKQVCGV